MATAHDSKYAGHRYVVPNRSDPMGGFNPRGPPFPDSSNLNVLRFTASHTDIRTAEVIDNTDAQLFHFESNGGRHLIMFDAEGKVIAKYEEGEVVYGANVAVKEKKFIKRGSPGSTGAVLTHDGQRYEFVQEIFYAIIRTTPANERVAIIYNYTGTLAIEMLTAGMQVPGLQAYLVFATALVESGVMEGEGLGKAIKKIISGKKRV